MAESGQYGGFWARLVALILDNAIVFVILLAALLSMGMVMATIGLEGGMDVVAWLILTFVPFLYWPVLESSRWQATFGKRIMGLEVTDTEGNRLGFLRALLRSLAKIVSSIPLGIGFLIAAFTARKQALHDIIVKTLVVRTGPSQLWKVFIALILGFVLMVASAAGLFYWVVMPMFKKGFQDTMKVEMKSVPQSKSVPAPSSPDAQPQQPPRAAAPAPQPAGAPAVTGKQGPDPEFDAVAGKPLTGMEKPGTTRAGPAILALDTVFPGTVWLKVYLPMPALGDPLLLPAPVIAVDRVLDSAGKDYYVTDSTFEKGEFFKRATLSYAATPVPHLAGIRNVHVKPGLSEQSLQKIEGRVSITLPVDPRSVMFGAKETGKEARLHDATVSLKSVLGNVATLHYRGPSEHMLLVRGYGADDKMLAVEGRSILPAKQDVDDDFSVTFKGPPAKVQIEVAAKVIERVFPFSAVRGVVAGPPASADGGVTLPPRVRTASAAPAPAAAPATKPEPRPEPKAETKMEKPKAEPKPKPVVEAPPVAREVAKPAARPRPAPVPTAAPSRPLGQSDTGCVYKPVMTDEEIARCR
jgi:uncharacterized RDD family membrane protein YckC